MTRVTHTATDSTFGLGIDAGGTQTRWALANADGEMVAEGAVTGLSGLQMATEHGRQTIRETIADRKSVV